MYIAEERSVCPHLGVVLTCITENLEWLAKVCVLGLNILAIAWGEELDCQTGRRMCFLMGLLCAPKLRCSGVAILNPCAGSTLQIRPEMNVQLRKCSSIGLSLLHGACDASGLMYAAFPKILLPVAFWLIAAFGELMWTFRFGPLERCVTNSWGGMLKGILVCIYVIIKQGSVCICIHIY